MIFWLASYPRSGNLLLRQILYTTMGQPSHHSTSDANEIEGSYSREIACPLDEFVAASAKTSEPVFVKTHLPPSDDHPAIYVVRDGRAAISSFLKYERTFSPGVESNTMFHLIFGEHHFGSWSEHYRAWHARDRGPMLTLRFEQLVDASPRLLREIASFIGYEGEIAPWRNPIEEWRELHPNLVGEGKTRWEPPDDWSFSCDAVFWAVHGDLMRELGLDDGQRVPLPPNPIDALLAELVSFASGAIARSRQLLASSAKKEAEIAALAHECHVQGMAAADRMAELESLTAERDQQARAADERLETIQKMTKELDLQAGALFDLRGELETQVNAASERLKLIEELSAERDLQANEAAARLQTIEELSQELDRQSAAASARLAMIESIDQQRFG